MAHTDYEAAKKSVIKGLFILGAITLVEVGLSLFLGNKFGKSVIIVLSLVKAYYILWFFMHLGDESKVLKLGVVLPFILLGWGLFAFLQEGNAWRSRRAQIVDPVKTEMFNHGDDKAAHEIHSSHDSEKHNEHH